MVRYNVNWNVYGIIEVEANSEEEAEDVVAKFGKEQFEKMILDEAAISFEFGTIEEIEEV